MGPVMHDGCCVVSNLQDLKAMREGTSRQISAASTAASTVGEDVEEKAGSLDSLEDAKSKMSRPVFPKFLDAVAEAACTRMLNHPTVKKKFPRCRRSADWAEAARSLGKVLEPLCLEWREQPQCPCLSSDELRRRFDNLRGRFPDVGDVDLINAMLLSDCHAGMAATHLIKTQGRMEAPPRKDAWPTWANAIDGFVAVLLEAVHQPFPLGEDFALTMVATSALKLPGDPRAAKVLDMLVIVLNMVDSPAKTSTSRQRASTK